MINRNIAPTTTELNHLDLVLPERIELSDQVHLFWIKDVKNETVKLDMIWDAGTKYQNKPLVSAFTNALMLSGTDELSAHQISEQIDYYGGYLSHDLDKDNGGITLYGLSSKIESIFNVFSLALKKAIFPENEFNKLVDIRKNSYLVSQEKVNTQCQKIFNQHIFGEDTLYGQVAELEDFDAITLEDVKSFYSHYYLTPPTLFLVGEVDDSFIEVLKKWAQQFQLKLPKVPAQRLHQTKKRIEVEKEKAMQTAIRVGRLMFSKNHPDYFKFQIVNTIFGGYFGSRLMSNIREDKGYTYGIGSGMAVLEEAAYFFISTEVDKKHKENTITEIYNEMDRLKTELVDKEELNRVKNYMNGDFLRHSDGPFAMMESYKNIYFNQLSENYYSDFIFAVNDITPQQIKEIAQKYFDKNEMLEVLIG